MSLTQIVIIIIGIILLLVLIIRFAGPLFPAKHTYTEIEINSSPAEVWRVIADNQNYPSWNPYHVKVEGDFSIGQPLVVHVNKPNGENVIVKPHLIRLTPNKELTWGGGIRGVFYGEHVFLLEETERGTTHLIHKESFTGFAVQFVPLEGINEGYAGMNQALKDWIESGKANSK